MKKIFLSLSAIALLAVGTVSCSSSDDSNPEPTPPGPGTEVAGKMTWAGTEYEFETTTTGVVVNAENQMIAYNIGTEEAPKLATRWIFISHEGEGTAWQTSENALWTQIFVPIEGNQAVFPNEAETIYLLATEVMIGGESVADPEGITGFNMSIAVWDEEAEEINYTTSTTFAEGTVNLTFKGAMNGPLGFRLASGESSSSLKSFENTQLTKESVNFNNVQKIDKAQLAKITK